MIVGNPNPVDIIESTIEEYEDERHFGAEFVAAEILRRLARAGYEVK